MPDANVELRQQIEELYEYLCNEENGNAWEQDFMSSIWKQFIEQSRSLSTKQVEKIEELYEKHIEYEGEDYDEDDYDDRPDWDDY